jgi:hypothetical protein
VVPARWSNSSHCKKLDYLQQMLPAHRDVQWPERPPDLSACNYFLWGYTMINLYISHTGTIITLKQNIREEIEAIQVKMVEQGMGNWLSRV